MGTGLARIGNRKEGNDITVRTTTEAPVDHEKQFAQYPVATKERHLYPEYETVGELFMDGGVEWIMIRKNIRTVKEGGQLTMARPVGTRKRDSRTVRVYVRLHPKEKQELERRAAAQGVSMREYLLTCALSGNPFNN